MNKFKEGDVVELKSGGKPMVVFSSAMDREGRIVYNTAYWCEEERKFKTQHAAESLLKHADNIPEPRLVKQGDMVQLPSGGPVVSVDCVIDGFVYVAWYCFEEHTFKWECFPEGLLNPVDYETNP